MPGELLKFQLNWAYIGIAGFILRTLVRGFKGLNAIMNPDLRFRLCVFYMG